MVSYLFTKYDWLFGLAGISSNSVQKLSDKLHEPHRFYHNTSHISDIISNIEKLYPDDCKEKFILIMVAYFHDAIYDPKRSDNEQRSADFFRECIASKDICDKTNAEMICSIILDTKTHEPSACAFELSTQFCDLDLYGLRYGNAQRVLTDEQNIFKEFQFHDYSDYKKGRLEFLEKYRKKINNDANVDLLKNILTFRRPKIAVYPGSFNPLHLGHRNIIEKAEKIFDKVIIAKGYNPDKNKHIPGADILLCNTVEAQKIKLQNDLPYHQVDVFKGYLHKFVASKSKDADIFVVRGLRNGHDLDYEVNPMRISERKDPTIKYVFIYCDKEYENISSSMIRGMEELEEGSASEYIRHGM